ncbi:hypothetical protein [Spiroplasma apis]|uniref:Uncharacterized protein n=1 Tax=Spiroplasma apis B31 TaxID=1276258 RepID=V5RI36_SPIAP|nr:hypothetical protein [Spiroplasma apis]AHB36209.1 hypothetical protein SAPIS_v1c03630 [Spiroplasma apis B31]
MAATKKSASKKTNNSESVESFGYIFQPFSPKSLALIHKYNLQTDESYKKLITSFERIDSLPDEDPRKINLVQLWEAEFNRLFKFFWENYTRGQKKSTDGISGWKERLDVKPLATSPAEKRKDFMSRLSPGANNSGRLTKEEIMSRAGYQSKVTSEQFNFTATPKTGKNLHEIENILNDVTMQVEEEEKIIEPESILDNSFKNNQNVEENKFVDEETEIMTQEAKPDPNLLAFVNGSLDSENKSEETKTESKVTENNANGYVANENMSREEFNIRNNIEAVEPIRDENEKDLSALELGIDFFQNYSEIQPNSIHTLKKKNQPIAYNEKDELIKPDKRNIIPKDGFEVFINTERNSIDGKQNFDIKTGESSKPYHEIKPIGHYNMNYDYMKRPSMQELLESNRREGKAIDEMTEKIEYLRELRNERRHRINMMKVERANSYIVARARRLAEERELRRIKKRDELNLKAIEKADRLRRMQERQKLIELMRERQMRRSEEKRVATVLKLERDRRVERDAKYRSEIASIDAEIRREQELIKNTELKMKAYFTRVHDEKLFDESLKLAKKAKKLSRLDDEEERLLQIEERKRREKVERISKKFNENLK